MASSLRHIFVSSCSLRLSKRGYDDVLAGWLEKIQNAHRRIHWEITRWRLGDDIKMDNREILSYSVIME